MMLIPVMLLFALLSGMQDAPGSILPKAPEGWRHERLEFPLSFAPTLAYEGVEELYFAPGMFDPASSSFFSYVLAIQLQGKLDIDGPWIRRFLQTYYTGLCDAVGNLDLDLTKLKTTVDRKEDHFEATIQMYDAFVTGKPMTLRLEISTVSRGGMTEFFGGASPLAKDRQIWTKLRQLRERWRADRTQSGSLNHLFIIPDKATYEAIAASEFVRRELAVFESRTTTRGGMTYTGIYFYGDSTYFEFLPPGAAELELGACGIAFGIEASGESKRVIGELQEQSIQTFARPVTRNLGEDQIPWFEVVGIEKPNAVSKLTLFTMEYSPEFLERWHADRAPGAGILRKDVLTRYRALLGNPGDDPLMQDVTRIELSLDVAETARFVAVCRALGHVVETSAGVTLCRGPGIVFEIRPSEPPGRIVQFELSLRRDCGNRPPIQLGNSELRFEAKTATWRFDLLGLGPSARGELRVREGE